MGGIKQGLTFREKPWGQLAPKFSDLVASTSILVDQAWKFSRQRKKSSRIGDPSGRNVELCILNILHSDHDEGKQKEH